MTTGLLFAGLAIAVVALRGVWGPAPPAPAPPPPPRHQGVSQSGHYENVLTHCSPKFSPAPGPAGG